MEERILEMLVDFENRCLVPASVTIVRGREYRHHILVVAPIITLHYKLMCSRNERETVVVVEMLRYVLPESISRAAG